MAANFLTLDKDLAIHYTGNPRVMGEARKRGIHCMTCPILRT